MSEAVLVYLPYSPWSEKARWALDHHRIACRREVYLPMLGEPLLRLRAGRWSGRVTVPLLLGDGEVLSDSYDIACWADARGIGKPLRAADAEVRRWNERSEAMLSAGRARTAPRVARDPAALLESLPSPLDKLGSLGLPAAKLGTVFLRRKYRFDDYSNAQHLDVLEEGMAALQAAIARRDTLLDTFSYADIAMAVALGFVSPVERYAELGPHSRVAWSEPELCERYPDVIAWRDAVYARHRER